MGPCPPELTGLTHGSVLSFPEVEAKLVPSSAAHLCPHHTSIMFSAPFVLTRSPFLPVGSLSSVRSSSLGWHLCLGASSPQRLPASVADICFLAHCFGLPVGMGHTRTREPWCPLCGISQSCPQGNRTRLGIMNNLGPLHIPHCTTLEKEVISHRLRWPATLCLEPPSIIVSAERLNQRHILAMFCP